MAFRPALVLTAILGSGISGIVGAVIGHLSALGTLFAIFAIIMIAAWSVGKNEGAP